MKKIRNNPDDLVLEMLQGYVEAHRNWFETIPGLQAFKKKTIDDKVIVMSNGGCGCEPMHIGYVGKGMGDATCVGELFGAPSAYSIYETAKVIEKGKGIILVCANFAGDYLNTDMAQELLQIDGFKVEKIVVNDDITSAPKENAEDRAGVAGIIFVLKILGAASEMGVNFEEMVRIGQKVKESIYTISVVLYAGGLPQTGEIMFEIPDDKIEFGMGFIGEPGIRTTNMMSADGMVDTAFNYLMEDMLLQQGDEVCVIVNSLGATTYMEQCVIFRKLAELTKSRGINIFDTKINRYLTSQEAGGFSITFLRLDQELKKYYEYPAYAPAFASFFPSDL